MKMVEKSKSQVWLPFGCVLFCLGCFANVFVPEVAQGAFVTKTIQFNESDGFAISGTSITASGEARRAFSCTPNKAAENGGVTNQSIPLHLDLRQRGLGQSNSP